MAIYHFSAKVISRANGSSAVASAAYRSASRLRDERLERCHDFTNKPGVVHSEIMLPDGAPEELRDREVLWNTVEAGEKRKDAQLSREVEFAIPREMSQRQGVELAREFVQRTFVDQGMVADLNVHWDVGADGLTKPHAHVMLSMREVGEEGFGSQGPGLEPHRAGGALARRLGRACERAPGRARYRRAHRSPQPGGPGPGPGAAVTRSARRRRAGPTRDWRPIGSTSTERSRVATASGSSPIRSWRWTPSPDGRRRSRATTWRGSSTGTATSKDQFDQAMAAVQASPELVALGRDGRGQERFTSREMIAVEERLHRAAQLMAERDRHAVNERDRDRALAARSRTRPRPLARAARRPGACDRRA